ncbi:class I SAM-dependent methyltransferase [Anaerosalibacter sp. Marseille-P3206]|uniref:class I SAM-dependent methyltransferase n=1 Tax=Anaerosalibacter sp. Marseille-P3206 TaxID=1871005 RepID=UPI0009874F8C|nr:class I SAM-dependent methyltransferase [Anaerosalibacter sp. Marseille-P3206]
MDYKYFKNAVEITKMIMEKTISPGNTVIDCTVGKGNDTINLAKLVGPHGRVYGFDIQKTAIKLSEEKLKNENLLERVILINDGHENLSKHISVSENVSFVVFNLGYLPEGDHSIITKTETTLIALKESLSILVHGGILLVTCYPGHDGGREEMENVEKFLLNLNQKEYSTLKFQFINQINNPPILYGVEKNNY